MIKFGLKSQCLLKVVAITAWQRLIIASVQFNLKYDGTDNYYERVYSQMAPFQN